MQTIHKRQVFKFSMTFIHLLFLWLAIFIQIGRASTSQQTIPTAPPTTAVIPTITSTNPPMNTPQTTVISTQPTQIIASSTPGFTASPAVATFLSSPSLTTTITGLPAIGTAARLTVTLAPTEVIRLSTTSTPRPTTTVFPAVKTTGTSGILYFFLGGGILLLVIIGVVGLRKPKHR
jgi:hypothetical protein